MDWARSDLLTRDVVSGLVNMMGKLLSLIVDGVGLRFSVGCIIILLFFGSFILLLILVLIIEVLFFFIIR